MDGYVSVTVVVGDRLRIRQRAAPVQESVGATQQDAAGSFKGCAAVPCSLSILSGYSGFTAIPPSIPLKGMENSRRGCSDLFP